MTNLRKTSRWIAIAVFILVCCSWLWLARKTSNRHDSIASPMAISPAASPAPAVTPGILASIKKVLLFQGALAEANARKLDFVGKVVDQTGAPVAGATVKGNALSGVDFDTDDVKSYTAVTDAAGNFEFRGIHGMHLGLIPSKAGYEYNLAAKQPWTESYVPDVDNRPKLVLWKLQGAEQLLQGYAKTFNIEPDGRLYSIDFLTCKKLEGAVVGDLTVQIERGDPLGPNAEFAWSATLGAVGGGLIPTTKEDFRNLAPEGGYQEAIHIQNGKIVNGANNVPFKHFYIKSRAGQLYGKLEIRIHIHGPQSQAKTQCDITYYANPNGSRNLEIDHNKLTKASRY